MKTHPYSIHIKKCLDKAAGIYTGELVSDALDSRLSEKGAVKVELDLIYQGIGRGVISLDQFLSNSLAQFVNHQKSVIDAVEKALYESFQRRDMEIDQDLDISFDDLYSAGDVWKYVNFKLCKFRIRMYPLENKQLKSLLDRFPGLDASDFAGDPPDATSYYMLTFDCQWEVEHGIEVEFNDDVFKGLFLG